MHIAFVGRVVARPGGPPSGETMTLRPFLGLICIHEHEPGSALPSLTVFTVEVG